MDPRRRAGELFWAPRGAVSEELQGGELTWPVADWRAKHPRVGAIRVASLVFSRDGCGVDRILLLQRLQRLRVLPGKVELPGGKVEETDHSLLDAGAWELFEETGLEAVRFVRGVDLGGAEPWRRRAKFSVEMEVRRACLFQSGDVRAREPRDFSVVLNTHEEEHERALWLTREQVRTGVDEVGARVEFMSEGMRAVILRAFRFREEDRGSRVNGG